MEHRKRWARALAGVCLVGGLVVGLAVPALATELTGSGSIQPGQTMEMGCLSRRLRQWQRDLLPPRGRQEADCDGAVDGHL
jgi:hypothetical protein